MSRRRVIPRQHRRFSLPATPTQLPALPGFSRSLPEGSDIFQQALEDLSINEPNHAPSKSGNTFGEYGFNGLNNIQELNESDYAESEDEVDSAVSNKEHMRSTGGRRHSSPSCFTDRLVSDLTCRADIKPGNGDSVAKQVVKLRKDYFIKHGHYPMSNGVKLQRHAQKLGSSLKTKPIKS